MTEIAAKGNKINLIQRLNEGFNAIFRRSNIPGTNIPRGVYGGFGSISDAGATVSMSSALTLSALYAGVRAISEDIGAKIPFSVYKNEPNGDRIELKNHAAYKLMRYEAAPSVPSYVFQSAMITSAILNGDGIAFIERDNKNIPTKLLFIPRYQVNILINENNELGYQINTTAGTNYIKPGIYTSDNILHLRGLSVDGLTGVSVIQYGANSIGGGLAAQQFANTYYKNGAGVGGTLEIEKSLGDTARKNLEDSFNFAMTDSQSMHKWKLLEEGVKAKPIQVSAEDAQILETRKFNIGDMCRWLRIPPHKVADMTGATFTNIEQQNIEYATDSLGPWVAKLEDEFTLKLLSQFEIESGVYSRGDLSEVLRGDSAAQINFMKTLAYIGGISPNEVRQKVGMNSYQGGNFKMIPSNMALIDDMGNITVLSNNSQNGTAEQGA